MLTDVQKIYRLETKKHNDKKVKHALNKCAIKKNTTMENSTIKGELNMAEMYTTVALTNYHGLHTDSGFSHPNGTTMAKNMTNQENIISQVAIVGIIIGIVAVIIIAVIIYKNKFRPSRPSRVGLTRLHEEEPELVREPVNEVPIADLQDDGYFYDEVFEKSEFMDETTTKSLTQLYSVSDYGDGLTEQMHI